MSDLNDPRVLFAADRTLLAWTRTSLTLMGFGFLIERFSLLLSVLTQGAKFRHTPHGVSFWVGIVYIFLGTMVAILANVQHMRILKTLRPIEVPAGYWLKLPVLTNFALAALGVGLTVYLLFNFP
ncbi:MAG: YidH family protein [Acidiferrobacterales bacterium]